MFIFRCGASFLIFLVIFSGGILYTFNQTKTYQAEGILEVLEARPVKSLSLEDLSTEEPSQKSREQPTQSVEAQFATEEEDLNTAFEVLQSNQIMMGVEQRIQGETRERFMAPYLDTIDITGPLSPMEILAANRSFEKVGFSKIFKVRYIHPDPIIAAEITNLFMKEFIDYYLKLEIDGFMKMVEDLRIRIEQMDSRIEEYAKVLNQSQTTESLNETQLRILNDEIEALYEFRRKLYSAFQESMVRVNMANPRARIVDAAFPPYADQPYKPNVEKNLSYAFTLGLIVACIPLLWPILRRIANI